MNRNLDILIIEDSQDDADLMLREFHRAGWTVAWKRVETEQAMRESAAGRDWRLIVADYSMPEFSALRALTVYHELGLDIPFIIVSGSIGETLAVEAMRAGAHDYLLKDNLTRLAPAVERELREAENRRQKRTIERDRQRAMDALRLQAVELARSNEELERFAWVAAHDLQEPLRMVSIFSEMLASRYKGQIDGDADEMIGYIISGTRRMEGLIGGVLNYSRVLHDREIAIEPVDPVPLVQEAIGNLHAAISETGAVLMVEPLPRVLGDRAHLPRIFQNLIANALKYSKPQETPKIRIFPRIVYPDCIFVIEDNGIGIRPEYHEKIFHLFRRLHGPEQSGLGVGLAVAKRLVEQQNGKIWVESQEGEGARFCFSLALADTEGANDRNIDSCHAENPPGRGQSG